MFVYAKTRSFQDTLMTLRNNKVTRYTSEFREAKVARYTLGD